MARRCFHVSIGVPKQAKPDLLQQQQQHDHGRLRLDAVTLAGRHVDPSASNRLVPVVSERHGRLALKKLQHSGHRGGVFGQFFALGKAEEDNLEPVVVEQRAAEDALVGRLNFFRQIDEQRVKIGRASCRERV